jgi:hypothetical protein
MRLESTLALARVPLRSRQISSRGARFNLWIRRRGSGACRTVSPRRSRSRAVSTGFSRIRCRSRRRAGGARRTAHKAENELNPSSSYEVRNSKCPRRLDVRGTSPRGGGRKRGSTFVRDSSHQHTRDTRQQARQFMPGLLSPLSRSPSAAVPPIRAEKGCAFYGPVKISLTSRRISRSELSK